MSHSFIRISQWYTKLTHWEYWPFEIVYLPVFFYWLWLSAKARSLFFFFLSNPSIETGGMRGESKNAILNLISDEYKPKGLFIHPKMSVESIERLLFENSISYPFIAKPDIGERGTHVEKIISKAALENYHLTHSFSYIIQEFIDYPIELGIFYYRFPNSQTGTISSITQKKYLEVLGDGRHTIEELMHKNPRASFQVKRFNQQSPELLLEIPAKNEVVLLEPIGNHCRGTMFVNANHLIDKELIHIINTISLSIPDFYFGRFDLKCRSIEELKQGKYIRIMELNGAGAEPAHIYHPGFSILKAYGVLLHHWKVLYEISMMNHAKGLPFPSFKDAKKQMFHSAA